MPAKRILVIEDDRDTLEIITYILREERYDVITLAGLSDTINIQKIRPDVILLDEWLGFNTGSYFCLQMKHNRLTAAIPVILVSAVSGLEEIAKKCEADAFIIKPFDIDELKNIVNRFVPPVNHLPILQSYTTISGT